MKHIFKISLSILLILLLFQIGSYYLYGKKRIFVCYCEHISPLLYNVNRLAIFSEKELKASEKEDIKEILEDRYQIVSFPKDSIQYDKLIYEKNVFTIKLSTDFKFPFQAVVVEGSRTKEYIEVWESELYWIMSKWYLRKRSNIGQS